MKKFGIFLGYTPKQDIKNQGISRLLTFIINAIVQKNNTQVIVALPSWIKPIFFELLADNHIDPTKIELITNPKIPYFLRIEKWLKKIKRDQTQRPLFFEKILNYSKVNILKLLVMWLSISSTPLFLLALLSIVLVSLILTPFLLFFFIFFVLGKLFKKILKKCLNRIYSIINQSYSLPIIKSIYHGIVNNELHSLITKMNKRKDIQSWFIPCLAWPHIKFINTKTIVSAPDIVFFDFPTHFFNFAPQMLDHLDTTINSAGHVICYSDYVKQNHLIKPYQIAHDKISIIKHAPIDLSIYFRNIPGTEESLNIIKDYQQSYLNKDLYLRDFNFSSIRYIFYSSQSRPHKNILNLIKAYEILLRKRYVNIKLILTADLSGDGTVTEYIKAKHLRRDIITFHNVSSTMLAALNHLAVCAVNPSFFEGGFPFTFSEAFSVGTPSIMSNIPVVSAEVSDNHLRQRMLFDPFNIHDMVEKIEWAVRHREELFELQKPFYFELKKRTWDHVATDYINLLTTV